MNILRYMQPFHTDHIPNVLFTGNDLHRVFEDVDCDKLLKDLSGKHFTKDEWNSLKSFLIRNWRLSQQGII